MSGLNELETDTSFLESADGQFLIWAHGLYHRELDLQSEERSQRATDAAFYDGEQFTQAELDEYEARNQKPRVFNEVKPTVDWILGGERRVRTDWAVLPRTEDDSQASIVKSKLVKYIDDINNARWHRSEAFGDMVKTGEGWTRIAYEPNQDGENQIILQHEHWRYMLADSKSRRPDMSDMQYMWCTKILPTATLINQFPDKKSELINLSQDMNDLEQELKDESTPEWDTEDGRLQRGGSLNIDFSSGEREGIKVYEMWYKRNERVKLLRGEGSYNNEIYDEKNPDHLILVKHYGFRTVDVTREQMYCAMYTNDTVLYRQKSPYKHNRFPFVRRFAYLKDRTGAPYGVIRSIRDPQSDLNIRRNRALFLLSSARVIMDKGAVDDKEQLAEEILRWDAVIEKKPDSKLEIQEGASMANAQINVGEQNSAYIRQISGVTGENRGMDSNATSGIAIQARQEQGTVITTVLADMQSLSRKLEGELALSLIEQFYDKPFQFRITADNLKDETEFARINDEADPQTNITKTQSDFVVAERDYRTTLRQALSEQLLSVAGTIAQHTGNPELAIAMLTSAIELQDFPDKDRLIGALRQAGGLPPLTETTEEKEKREAANQEALQKQADEQAKLHELELRERIAKISETESRVRKTELEVEISKVRVLADKMMALKSGIETGATATQHQQILPIVDQLLEQVDDLLNLHSDQPGQEQQALPPQEQPPMPEQMINQQTETAPY